MLQRLIRGLIPCRSACRRTRLLPEPRRYRPRSRRPAPAGGRPETQAAPAVVEPDGPGVLDRPSEDLGWLEGRARNREARNGRRLASGWFPPVLAMAIPAAWWPAKSRRGTPNPDPAAGTGKSRLG